MRDIVGVEIPGMQIGGLVPLRDHIGAGTPDPQPIPYELTRGQQADVPEKADVVYQSAAIDYQNFTQTTNREATLVRKADVLQLPVVMSENDAMAGE